LKGAPTGLPGLRGVLKSNSLVLEAVNKVFIRGVCLVKDGKFGGTSSEVEKSGASGAHRVLSGEEVRPGAEVATSSDDVGVLEKFEVLPRGGCDGGKRFGILGVTCPVVDLLCDCSDDSASEGAAGITRTCPYDLVPRRAWSSARPRVVPIRAGRGAIVRSMPENPETVSAAVGAVADFIIDVGSEAAIFADSHTDSGRSSLDIVEAEWAEVVKIGDLVLEGLNCGHCGGSL
jgi:hypothetical protein